MGAGEGKRCPLWSLIASRLLLQVGCYNKSIAFIVGMVLARETWLARFLQGEIVGMIIARGHGMHLGCITFGMHLGCKRNANGMQTGCIYSWHDTCKGT